MDFSASALFAGLVFGAFGLYVFKEGKRKAHIPWLLIGVGLMAYPYFVPGVLLTWGTGAGLLGAAYLMR